MSVQLKLSGLKQLRKVAGSCLLLVLLATGLSAATAPVARIEPFNIIEQTAERHELKLSVESRAYLPVIDRPAYHKLLLPVEADRSVSLELERLDIVAPDAKFVIGGPGGDQPIGRPDVVQYVGTIDGDPSTFAVISYAGSGLINGYVDEADGRRFFVSTQPDDLDGSPVLTVREAQPGFAPDRPFCGLELEADLEQTFETAEIAAPADNRGPRLLIVAIDSDQRFYELFGNIEVARDYIVQLVGTISAIYQRDLNIRLSLGFARLWPSGGEPFNASDLGGFKSYWINNEDPSGFNIVHMFSGARNTPYGGVAYIADGCPTNAYGIDAVLNGTFAAPLPESDNSSWDVVVAAHEMGHNLGTQHTHDGQYSPHIDDCGNGVPSLGTIMSYCHIHAGYLNNTEIRFHRLVQQTIVGTVAFANCAGFDCNGNNVDDATDISLGTSLDVNSNGIPDECEDCNGNGILDDQDIANGAPDLNGNGVPDECEADCDGNGFPDQSETWSGAATDLDGDCRPDICQTDCNNNGLVDYYDITNDLTLDYNRNRVIDQCEDCNGNLQFDWYDVNREHAVLVADLGPDRVREFHPVAGVSTRYVGSSLTDPYDVIYDDINNRLLVASFGLGLVAAVDIGTGSTSILITAGSGGLTNPSGLKITPTGDLLVSDFGGNAVRRYNLTTGAYIGNWITGITGPMAMEYGPNSNLYVIGRVNNLVNEYNGATGALVGTFVSSGAGGLSSPRDLLFLDNGNLLVSSFNTSQVLEYDGTTGSFVRVFTDDFGITQPWGLARATNGNVLISCLVGSQGRIVEYFPDLGIYFRSFVRGTGELTSPTAIAQLPASPNDVNGNYIPDACESVDSDGDGVLDYLDNCPLTPNPSQADADGDGVGDVCDNCPSTANADQRDADVDGIGDVCDGCVAVYDPSQADSDGDGRNDACDNCPNDFNPAQTDTDNDGIGDVCDACVNDPLNDGDGDGICGNLDNCPGVYNPGQEDANGNGIGDVCEPQLYDTVSTGCVRLSVGTQGNFGNTNGSSNAGTVNMDHWIDGDCETVYLYDGSPMVLYDDGSGIKAYSSLYGSHDFVNDPSGNATVWTTDLGDYESFQSGGFKTSDGAIGFEKVWIAPQIGGSTCNTVIQAMAVYSADGNTHTGVTVGEFLDWDVPSTSGSANSSGVGSTTNGDQYVYQTGFGTGSCLNNTQRAATIMPMAIDTSGMMMSCADFDWSGYGAFIESNPQFVYPTGGPIPYQIDSLITANGTTYSAASSTEDLFTFVTYLRNVTLQPSDTVIVYSILASTTAGTSSLGTYLADAETWFKSAVAGTCGCCVGQSGDINNDGIDADPVDLSFLVDFLFSGGPAAVCSDEADLNGDAVGGDPVDLSYLVDFLFSGGPAPVACP